MGEPDGAAQVVDEQSLTRIPLVHFHQGYLFNPLIFR